ncbi:alpha/beta hydrolase [Mycobacterium sp. MYCO198283]|uniref:alpha/beta hydrolase n=1 Tax=Mycobacterium sp. MYCO198283 TaxID=2883505 RepID=UPI001E2A0298|nr:alpha/beta hydrolase [Mycobacterium sp. MYCO198283]MCG5433920.1 alpha/beta hydrolase [Mycobacterium sp. MYCO198283]
MVRHARLLGTFAVLTALLAGCAPGLSSTPPYVVDDGGGARADEPTTAPPTDGPPPLQPPKNDLSWSECTSRLFTDAGVRPAGGVRLECASFDADLDSINGAPGSVTIGVVRASGPRTPADAAPLVLTTGSDIATSLQLPQWLSRSGADLLAQRPIVAVDRRGMGLSGALTCRDTFDSQEMRDQAQTLPGDDPVATLGEISRTATTSCTDVIAPGDSAYDNAHAAEDLEKLRSKWDVPALALLGIGNGGQVAMAYAGLHPGKVARLVIDSPIAPGVSAEAAAETEVKGQQAAFDAFAQQCAALPDCALGANAKPALDGLLATARGNGPGAPSTAAVTDAIVTALGYPESDRVGTTTALASALAQARGGDTNALNNLVNRAESLRDTDGQFVNGCSDSLNRPTPDRVRELVVEWGKVYPQFGSVAALNLVDCLNWPSGTAPQAPRDLKTDVLLLGVEHDPIVGTDGLGATAAAIINAGATSRRVMWQGIGHGAAVYTACAAPPLLGYLDTGDLPGTDIFCPA